MTASTAFMLLCIGILVFALAMRILFAPSRRMDGWSEEDMEQYEALKRMNERDER